jgi:hypothetical protein
LLSAAQEETAVAAASSDFHEHENCTTMAVTTSSPIKPTPDSTASEAPLWTSSGSTSDLLPLRSAAQEETAVAAASLAQSPATVSSTDLETNQDKVSSMASICPSEVNFDVGEFFFAHDLHLTFQQDYADCILDDGDLAKELSDEDHSGLAR